jgi:Ca-activated chloride channel family protein
MSRPWLFVLSGLLVFCLIPAVFSFGAEGTDAIKNYIKDKSEVEEPKPLTAPEPEPEPGPKLTDAKSQPQAVVIILDGSGSMWGHVEGTPKIAIAKEVLTGLIKNLPDDVKVGLWAYGHRYKDKCEDVEALFELGPMDKPVLIKKVKALNPKGMTPITRTVELAADSLKTFGGSAVMVLVSDGKETCKGDPCELVRSLRESGAGFVLHVIGFDVTDEEKQQLSCVAEAGGGTYYSADNADQFQMAADALVRELDAAPMK